MFIIGSFLFFVGAIISLWMRKTKFDDPMRDHHEKIRMEMIGASSYYSWSKA